MNRLQNCFNHVDLPSAWSTIVEILMKYITLQGWFCHFHTHLFPMLNHISCDIKVNFPFWLMSSLEQSIINVQDKCKKLPIHQGLILCLCKFHSTLLPSPTTVHKNTLTIINPTNHLEDLSPSVTIDETLLSICHSTQARGKAPMNDKTPLSLSNALPYQSPHPFPFLLGRGTLITLMMMLIHEI